jgi:methyl-accepting chemotaxis protein
MVTSMAEISKVAKGNAAAIEEVSRTARSQLEAVTATLSSSEALTKLADHLRGSLASFRTDETTRELGALQAGAGQASEGVAS